MSETIDNLTDDVVLARNLLPSITKDLDLKGGEGPNIWFPKDAIVQPIYIVGVDNNLTSLLSTVKRTSVSATGLSNLRTAVTFGKILTVPDGATKLALYIKNSGAGAFGTSTTMGFDFSDDGVTFLLTNTSNNSNIFGTRDVTGTPQNQGKATYFGFLSDTGKDGQQAADAALPKFIRPCFLNSDAAVDNVIDYIMVVS